MTMLVVLLAPAIASAQESSSLTPAAAAPAKPADALRDLLAAACSQSGEAFAKFLSPRNAQSFAHLTAAARVALMKRLVLLDEPGKPSATLNPSGRPVVTCQTTLLTTEMRIGGAEQQDNLAFLPLEIRSLNDPAGADARQIQIGLARDSSGWKLLSVGLLLLDLPALEIEWNRASMDANERAAVETVRELARAVESHRRTHTKLPESLAQLAAPEKGAASAQFAGLLDAELAAGSKSGYSFRYVIEGASAVGAQAKFQIAATPQIYGTTGRRSFLLDGSGVIHAADRQGALASPTDPRVD